jgi:death on curing protein
MTALYFDLTYTIKTHDKIIEISGGRLGIRDKGLLESVLEHVKNDAYYPTLTDKLTHLVYSIAMNHAFVDGNKRSSIALGGFFLEINGYDQRVGTFILEMENIVLWVVQKKIDKLLLSKIIDSVIEHGELTEEIKLELLTLLK